MMLDPKKIRIAPQCRHLIAELRNYKYPVRKEGREHQMYDHEYDPYFWKLLGKYGRR